MRKIFFILMICIFSSCVNGSYVFGESDLYEKINSIIEFGESGIKISYKTNSDIKDILQEINDLDLCYLDDILIMENNIDTSFSFEKESEKNSIKILIGKSIGGYNVDIEIIDKKKLISVDTIKLKFSRLKNIIDLSYFTFIRGKAKDQCRDELEKNLFNILDCYNIQNKSSILLENGLTGIFTVQKRLKINYSIMNYNDGTYLIMGSPIIFITY